ncbi:hypothetical protein HN011_007456 [Eciton burchellii]|nr:hypothetical protein HN011_007456 [Eciton burchellii]
MLAVALMTVVAVVGIAAATATATTTDCDTTDYDNDRRDTTDADNDRQRPTVVEKCGGGAQRRLASEWESKRAGSRRSCDDPRHLGEDARRDPPQVGETVFSRNYRIDSNPPVLIRQADDNRAIKYPGRDGSTRCSIEDSIEGTEKFSNVLAVHGYERSSRL